MSLSNPQIFITTSRTLYPYRKRCERERYIEREREAERDGDDKSTDQNGDIVGRIAVENVVHLSRRGGPKPYRISAERHISRQRIDAVDRENDDVCDKDHQGNAFFRGTFHIAENGNELHLRAVAIAEHW